MKGGYIQQLIAPIRGRRNVEGAGLRMSILKNFRDKHLAKREQFLRRIITKAEYLLKNNDINKAPYTITNYVILHYYVKALKLAKGIVALCKKRLDSDAQILFRSLFEIGCYCEYINIDAKDIKRAENCIAISYIENKRTENYIKRYGSVNVDKMPITHEEKKALQDRVNKTQEIRNINYEFIIGRLKERDPQYKGLSDNSIIKKEKLTLTRALKEINEIFNKETEEANAFWKYYVFCFRTCAESVHSTDFDKNVKIEENKLEYRLESKESTIQMILSVSPTFLFRIMDISGSILQFKEDNTIKDLFNQLKILQEE